MMKKLLLAAVPAVLFSTQLQAGCKTPDFNGTWIMYQANLGEGHTGRCELTFSKGQYTGHCVMAHDFHFDATGTVTVDKSCGAVMTMDFTGGSATFDLQLSRNKQMFAGQWSNSFGTGGVSNGVKQ